MRTVVIGSTVIVAMMWVLLTFHPIEGAATRWYQNLFAAVFVVVFGFLFVTVAGRISGLARQLFQSHQRHEYRHVDGHLRDFFCGRAGPRLTMQCSP